MRRFRQAAGWTLVGVLAVFIAVNLREAEVRLVFVTVRMPMAFVVLASSAAGAGAAWLLGLVRRAPAGRSP